MANTTTNILDKILAIGLLSLREQAIMARLVNSDYQREAAQEGQAVNIPLPPTYTVQNVTASPTHSSGQDTTFGNVQLNLNNWKHVDFHLTDKERAEIDKNRHFVPMSIDAAVKALANDVDNTIFSEYTGVHGYTGTAGTAPFGGGTPSPDDAINVRKILNEQLAPMDVDNRYLVLDPTAEAEALQVPALSDFDKVGDRDAKIQGVMGRKYGLNFFMDQNVPTHTAGSLASVGGTVASTTAAGASSIDIAASAGTQAVVVGDVFTIAGDTETYVVQAAVGSMTSASAQAVTIDPPLAQIASANAAVDVKATHTVNLGFHRNAFAWASRPIADADDTGLGSRFSTATDPISGISLRVELTRQNKQVKWDFDILHGAKIIRPELAVRLAG